VTRTPWFQRSAVRVVRNKQDARLIDSQFTLVDATLAFLWSRMFVVDEVKDWARRVLAGEVARWCL
jgi:hypothetical protein